MTPAPDIIRYPVGPFKFSDPFRTEDRPLWLAQLTDAPAKLRAAVDGLNGRQLDTPYREGGWTLRQVVHHLADAQLKLVHPAEARGNGRCANDEDFRGAALV